MTDFRSRGMLVAAAVAGAALLLGACSSMTTYGTGKTAAAQTVEDLTGVLSLGAKKKGEEPIDYAPRAPIVAPPAAAAAALPPPGSEETAVAAAGDWPNDPDEELKRIEKKVAELNAAGETPKFTLPEGAEPVGNADEKRLGKDTRTSVEKLRAETKIDVKKQKEMFADARMAKVGSFDKDGRPVRRYLTEPPVDYRAPDPESPVVVTEKPKKGKWALPDLWPF